MESLQPPLFTSETSFVHIIQKIAVCSLSNALLLDRCPSHERRTHTCAGRNSHPEGLEMPPGAARCAEGPSSQGHPALHK
eukprot:scaffold220852_cov42-Prasinocladus_malaysianus.AAC.1